MLANSSAFGFGITAQSANTKIPLSPYWGVCVNIRNAPETHFMPGAVLIICKAGRNTLPVVFSAPAISPSASPALIIKQAKNKGSSTRTAAFSGVIPFFWRSWKSKSAYAAFFSWFFGSTRVASPMWFNPKPAANSLISAGFPIKIMSATPSASNRSAALRVLSSVPSGRTIRCLSALARAIMSCIKSIAEDILYYLIIVLVIRLQN